VRQLVIKVLNIRYMFRPCPVSYLQANAVIRINKSKTYRVTLSWGSRFLLWSCITKLDICLLKRIYTYLQKMPLLVLRKAVCGPTGIWLIAG